MSEAPEALEAIDLLYRAALEPALWPEALHKLAQTVGGIGTAMIPITPNDTTGLVVSPELREPNVEYERDWWRRDTRVARIHSRKLSRGVCSEAELFTAEELARDPLRQEFLRSYGIGAFAAHLVAPLPNFVVAFSVQRALKHGQFEQHQLKTLNLLGKHAARALIISTRLAAAGRLERTLAGALAQIDCGAFVVDHQLKIITANQAAERLMGDGLSVQQGQLRAASREHQSALTRLIKSVLRSSADAHDVEPIALPRPSGRTPLLLQAIPVPAGGGNWNLPNGATALVIVVDPEQSGDHSPVTQLRLLGLTPSEAQLAALIGAGHSRAEAAGALGITEWTARDTLKQVYSKLDISRQSELVRLVDRLGMLKSPPPTR